ncbi:hypothetical protein EX30DRAFT_349577 [Ascodesmis nigricans]|uniref:Uncharacterized protein n=1 Tax=Ascodesmis nigricans TaxID=341454 RepID=A0A4V3SIH2_9PEZI|nr:hypothetical protein EX30DRAFT_349577 [Ascodesmis nigricans]
MAPPTSALPLDGPTHKQHFPASPPRPTLWGRRESLLSSSFSRAEYSTVEMGAARDGSTRVIAYVKTSQGFNWNQDIFIPSSSDITVHNGINVPECVHDIILTEEDRFLPS